MQCPEPQMFVILLQDVERFIEALSETLLSDYADYTTTHDFILSNPATNTVLTHAAISDSQSSPMDQGTISLHEAVLDPYRKRMRGFSYVAIRGTSKEVITRTLREIKTPASEDPQIFIAEIEEMKQQGNTAFNNGDLKMASEVYVKALLKIQKTLHGNAAKQLLKNGGTEFQGQIESLRYCLNSNRAMNSLRAMQNAAAELKYDLVQDLQGAFEHAIYEAEVPCLYWQPSQAQKEKLAYRKTTAANLLNRAYQHNP